MVNVPLRDQAARGKVVRAVVPRHEPVVREVVPRDPAAVAGLMHGDRIVRVNGDTVATWEQLVGVVEGSPGESLAIVAVRDGREVTFRVTPRSKRVVGDGGPR